MCIYISLFAVYRNVHICIRVHIYVCILYIAQRYFFELTYPASAESRSSTLHFAGFSMPRDGSRSPRGANQEAWASIADNIDASEPESQRPESQPEPKSQHGPRSFPAMDSPIDPPRFPGSIGGMALGMLASMMAVDDEANPLLDSQASSSQPPGPGSPTTMAVIQSLSGNVPAGNDTPPPGGWPPLGPGSHFIRCRPMNQEDIQTKTETV